MGFYIAYDHFYSPTPIDVIPFAGTGGDGIHFGFLTDFGTHKDLNKAPIVCVAPSDDPPVKLVAKNLKDFLSLIIIIKESGFLSEDYKNDKELKERIKEWGEDVDVRNRKQLIKILKENFEIKPILKLCQYTKDLRKERQADITIHTEDGIGIIFGERKLSINGFDYKSKDIKKIKSYLKRASLPERIKFYRDATYCYVLSEGYEADIQKTLVETLRKDGFAREAKILAEKC